ASASRLVAGGGAGAAVGGAFVGEPAAEDIDRVGGGGGGIAGKDITTQGRMGPGLVEDAAPAEAADGRSVGDGQAGQGHRCSVADVEDPAGGVAADGQAVGAGAFDVQVLVDDERTAGQGDGLCAGGGRGVGGRA